MINALQEEKGFFTLKNLRELVRFFEVKGSSKSFQSCISSLNERSWTHTVKKHTFSSLNMDQLRLILIIFHQPEPQENETTGLVELVEALFDNNQPNPTG